MQLNLIHRGKALPGSGEEAVTLGDLRTQVCATLSVPAENVRLLADGKLLPPAEDRTPLPHLLRPSQTVLVLATKPETVAHIKEAKQDTTLRPFDAKTPKYVAAPRKTPQRTSKYGFGSVSVLQNLPNSDQARQILEQLASDRGFLGVMEKKRWNVGELREMPPEGRVGVDPVCILGLNTNKGQQIHLRLRTDDMKGFRAMSSIRQVLAHELAHNEFSEHDDNFKELMRWIEKTAARDNWRSLGHRLDDGWNAPDFGAGPSGLKRNRVSSSTENKLGSVNGPTGVSRLLEAHESNSAKARSDGTEQDSVVEVTSDANAECGIAEDGAQRIGCGQDEARGSKVEGSEACTPLGEVMCLGFSKELAVLALRENGRDASRAADWLLSQIGRRQVRGEMGEAEAELTERVQNAVTSLGNSVNWNEWISALDALHLYMSNLLRHPGVERFCRINSANRGFQKRVGAFGDAVEVLRVAGFGLAGGFWEYKSLDVSRVWIAKSVVEDRLLEELMKWEVSGV